MFNREFEGRVPLEIGNRATRNSFIMNKSKKLRLTLNESITRNHQ